MPSADTQFKPGAAWRGNAKGRPRKDFEAARQAVVFRSISDETVARILDRLVEAALQGDVQAAKAVLGLVLPRTPDPFEEIIGAEHADHE